MRRVLAHAWPRSLAGRLTVVLVSALALAQLALTLILHNQQDSVVAGIVHSQTLNQTVTLARLLNAYPVADAARLTDAFASRQSCAVVVGSAPPAHSMTSAERRLAEGLTAMLHGIRAGSPEVSIGPAPDRGYPCESADTYGGGRAKADRSRPQPDGGRSPTHPRAAVTMSVPLLDGRWLTVTTMVDVPHGFDRITLLSFLLSCVAVAGAAVVAVRFETRSLRALADASERFGRGENVAPLPASGPSEVIAVTRAFNTMQERLSLFLRDRLRLLASISHDLRTPLTTLRLKAEFIGDEAVRDDVVATVEEMTVICDTTLAFTRAEATSEESRRIDLADLVGEVADEFRIAGHKVTVAPAAPLECTCRPVALKRALRNLVENAVRYGGDAAISLGAAEGSAVIDVDDTGPGLPPDRIAEAFEPFVRLEPSRSSETGGIGLGLAIAQGIVRAHGGTLTLVNRPAGGLRAEIALPCKNGRSGPGRRQPTS